MLDYVMLNPPGLAFDGGSGNSPTVFTLTLDDLSTRFAEYDQAQASIKFKLTTGAGTTANIFLDGSNGSGSATGIIASETTLATRIHDALEALTGYSGKVEVSGAVDEGGDKYDFTITFDASLGAVLLSFGTSQWHPTIALVETTNTTGSKAAVTVEASGADDTTIDNEGNSVSLDSGGIYSSHMAGSGWQVQGSPGSTMTFERVTGDPWDSGGYGVSSGNGSASVASNGSAEVHTLTPQPVVPTGGTWKPGSSGNSINHNAGVLEIATEAVAPEWSSVISVNGTLDSGTGAVQIANGINGDVGNLDPVNVNLTVPEITHSITPA